MIRTARVMLAAAAITLSMSGMAMACSRAMPKGADQVIAANGRIDAGLVDAAIRAEVNYHRCRAGLPELAGEKGLARVAAKHAEWMARARKLSHRSTVPGQSTAVSRLKASRVKFRAGSENIGYLARFRIDGTRFRIVNSGACHFEISRGKPVPPHSYASLARTIVQLWMESPAHRRNILDRKVSRVGSGAALDPKAEHCGRFYVSQSFAG